MKKNQKIIDTILIKLSKYLNRELTEDDLKKGYDSLGADSMDMVTLAYEMEIELGIEINPEIFLQYDMIMSAVEEIIQKSLAKN